MRNTLFVTATDTGAGKTFVTTLLALKMRQMGRDCVAFKPFASGCERVGGALVSEDAEFLRVWLDLKESAAQICPIRLEEPLAPLIAARRAGLSTRAWPSQAREALAQLQSRHEWVIVEGVGGLLAPIWEKGAGFGSNLDLIQEWKTPAVVVARRTLGTINHTLLTLRAPATFAGVVFNDAAPVAPDDVAARTNPPFIAGIAGVPIWGKVPFAAPLNAQALQEMAQRLEIPALVHA